MKKHDLPIEHLARLRRIRGLARLMAFRAVLDAANRVSAERGPTNAALGRNASGAAARDGRFRSFRRASDDALDAVRRIGPFGTSLAALEEEWLELEMLREELEG